MSTREHPPPTSCAGQPSSPLRFFVYVYLSIFLLLLVFVEALNVEMSETKKALIEVRVVKVHDKEIDESSQNKERSHEVTELDEIINIELVSEYSKEKHVIRTQVFSVHTSTDEGKKLESFVVVYELEADRRFPYARLAEMLKQVGDNVRENERNGFKQFLDARTIRIEASNMEEALTILLGFHRDAFKEERKDTAQKKWVVESNSYEEKNAFHNAIRYMEKNPVRLDCKIAGTSVAKLEDAQLHYYPTPDYYPKDQTFVSFKRDEAYKNKTVMRFKLVHSQWEDLKAQIKVRNLNTLELQAQQLQAHELQAQVKDIAKAELELWLSYKTEGGVTGTETHLMRCQKIAFDLIDEWRWVTLPDFVE
eukprot:GHVS01101776.1.p1 GENE.GHVS01101776.1~~GHVS01101776.1.p1  ORF type:complete len:365 (+),score=45.01 GHVS01101776.1:3-1097(+)